MKLSGTLTPTKIMAFVILTGACISGVILNDAYVVITGITISGGLLGYRKHEQRKIINKEADHERRA